MASWNIVESELIEWLRAYDGPRFHAVLSDPPYALISIARRFGKPGSAPAKEGQDGRYERVSRGFMNARWDGFDSLEEYQKWISEWAKLLIEKALYPGAVCMFFGGTRTFHHLGVGLERGGFEIVDCLMWLTGQGFPKSHDISKGLDKTSTRAEMFDDFAKHFAERRKASGKTQKEIARHFPSKTDGLTGCVWNWENAVNLPTLEQWAILQPMLGLSDEFLPLFERANWRGRSGEVLSDNTSMTGPNYKRTSKGEPITSDAETWDGYGTALKPAWEPIYLCRAPRGGKTFASLAVEFGTGALNIDGSRIGNVNMPESRSTQGNSGVYAWNTGEDTTKPNDDPAMHSGRWPANFVLCHHEDCIAMGELVIQNPSGSVSGEEPSEQTKNTYGESIERKPFEAHGKKVTHYRRRGRTINRFKQGMMPFGNAEGEEYETVEFTEELIERWACVPECPIRMLDDQIGNRFGRSSGGGGTSENQERANTLWNKPVGQRSVQYYDKGGPSRFFYTAKASRSEKDKGLEEFYWKRGDDGFERISFEEWEKLDKRTRARGCIHPTIKPLQLLRYLSTLSLPPKQEGRIRRMLIPFSGSGSEMIGAAQAGWDEITGIEMEENYVMMAEARISATVGMF